VRDGVVSVSSDASRRVTYGELVQAGVPTENLRVTGSGFTLNVQGSGTPKNPAAYSVVGKPLPRTDLAEKVLGTFTYMVDVRVPGMLHGRIVRPTGAGAKVQRVDDGAAKRVSGFVATVVKGDFVGVVAETEWAAIKAARALTVTWSASTRNAVTTVWCGGQKPHQLQKGCAEFLGCAPERVRVVWVEDSGSYGRPGFEDAAVDAIVLSQAVGKPVRVQWMRADMTRWGPKGPAAMFQLIAGLDDQGNVSGFQFAARAFSGAEINFIPTSRSNFIAAHLTGIPNTSGYDEFPAWGSEAPPYAFPDIVTSTHVVPSFHAAPSPLACTHLRDPNGPSTSFAVESFIDELAVTAGVDPIEFRSRYLDQPRAKAVMTAAAQKYGWETRTIPKSGVRGNVVTGRGAALGIRNGTYVGNVAEVEVDRRTGMVRVTRFVVAHDCGLIVNPAGLTATDPGEHRPDDQPYLERRSPLRSDQRDERRLGDVSDCESVGHPGHRGRPSRSPGSGIKWRGRACEPGAGRRHRQCGLRRHWR
jgi:CO/xanthine dehydrogenase Mo-binding subunit